MEFDGFTAFILAAGIVFASFASAFLLKVFA